MPFGNTRNTILGTLAAALLSGATTGFACPPHYTIEYFDGPGSSSETTPLAINAHGDIVGEYYASVIGISKAFKWTSGPDITLLTFPAGTTLSHAYSIADDGAITGDYDPPGAELEGFLRIAGGAFSPMGVPEGMSFAYPSGVNSAHVVVGQYGNVPAGLGPYAFIWEDGKFTDFTADLGHTYGNARAISENGLITGDTGENQPNSLFPFIWDHGKATILEVPPGAMRATGIAITNNGLVCGESHFPPVPPSGGYFAMGTVWINGQAITVGTLPGDLRSTLNDVNQSGQAVGDSWNSNAGHGVLWMNGVLYNLRDLMLDADSVVWVNPKAINDAGQIAALVRVPSLGGWLGARLNPVPPQKGDVNCDSIVDVDDLFGVINAWGPCGVGESCGADLNSDESVDVGDLGIVLKNWGF